MTVNVDRLIIHQFDPGRDVPGGINTCIEDIVRYAPAGYSIAIAGVSDRAGERLGDWTERTLHGREILFMPLAHLAPEQQRRLVPHSARVAAGLARFRRRVPHALTQTHRVDLGAAAHSFLSQRETIQFIHTDTERALARGTDSMWRFAPAVYRQLEQASLKRTSRVITFSRSDAERLRLAGLPARPMMTWFDPALFFPAPPGRDDDVLRLVWVGRLEPPKAPELALQALSVLVERGITATLTVVGDGTLRPLIERRIAEAALSDMVSLTGWRSRHEIAEILRASSALVMSSRFEGSPRALIEALACGIPVACTPESDPDGLVRPGRTGIVASSRDPDCLADAILAARQTPPRSCLEAVVGLRAPDAVARLLAA